MRAWQSVGALSLAIITGGTGYLAGVGQKGVIEVEGGFVHDPNDSGGKTNYGITDRVAASHGYDVETIDPDIAVAIYAADYISKPRFDQILQVSPAVGTKAVDAGINAGPARAARWYQMALNDYSRGGRDYAKITEDGQIGPRTIAAHQALERTRGHVRSCQLLLKAMDAYQYKHYADLGRQSYKNASFVVGWADHRIGNVPPVRCAETVEAS